jgi:hypothetical protein
MRVSIVQLAREPCMSLMHVARTVNPSPTMERSISAEKPALRSKACSSRSGIAFPR